MLTSPRFQQLGTKTIESMNQNKPQTLMKLIQLYKTNIEKISPEMAKKLDEISEEELKEFLNQREAPKE